MKQGGTQLEVVCMRQGGTQLEVGVHEAGRYTAGGGCA